MAVPSTEINHFRSEMRAQVQAMRAIDNRLAIIEDHGANDAERQAFFEAEFGPDSNNPDLTWTEFATGIVGVRALRTAWDTNKEAIAKLLK